MLPGPSRVTIYNSDSDRTPKYVIFSHKSAKLVKQSEAALSRSLKTLKDNEKALKAERPDEYRNLLLKYNGLTIVLRGTEDLLQKLATCKKWNILKYRGLRKEVVEKSLDLFLDSLQFENRTQRTSDSAVSSALRRRESMESEGTDGTEYGTPSTGSPSHTTTDKGKEKALDRLPDPSYGLPPPYDGGPGSSTSGTSSVSAQSNDPVVIYASWGDDLPSDWRANPNSHGEKEDEESTDFEGETSRFPDGKSITKRVRVADIDQIYGTTFNTDGISIEEAFSESSSWAILSSIRDIFRPSDRL